MHCRRPERRRWIADRLESSGGKSYQQKILERLIRAISSSKSCQARYLGTKALSPPRRRTALDSLVDSILDTRCGHGALESTCAMVTRAA